MFQIIKISKNNELNPLLWFYFPLLIALVLFIIKFLNINFFITYFKGENGIIENGTFLFLFFSIITSFLVLSKLRNNFRLKNSFIFIIIFLIGLIYFAGEEISWGQNWFSWETNTFFKKFNDQLETNFHNISSWFDQKPRALLLFFVLFGGIFLPLYYLRKKKNMSKTKDILLPNISCLPTSLICLFFYLLDSLYKILCSGKPGIDISCKFIPALFVLRTSEIIEFYIALFLLIYIFSIYTRLKKN